MAESVRINKFLASTGTWSRRGSEALIAQGRVRIDGEVVREQGVQVDPEHNVVEVDGERVEPSPTRWIALHKPPGVVCTRSDPKGRPTVYAHLRTEHEELFHVGRLDMMSEGLLLMTNDGDLAQALLHPSSEVRRRYEVTTHGPLPPDLASTLKRGVRLDDGLARAEDVRVRTGRGAGKHVVTLTLREGRNREVRRMMAALDVKIDALRRVAFGPIELGRLKRGCWRPLRPRELRALRGAAKRTRR